MLNAKFQDEHGAVDRLTDAEIIGQSITFMLAGHETTANSMSLTAYNLAMHPDIQDKLYQEIKDIIGDVSIWSELQTYCLCIEDITRQRRVILSTSEKNDIVFDTRRKNIPTKIIPSSHLGNKRKY